MTPKEKELLLKDICGRLPYGVKVTCEKYPFPVTVLYAGNVDEVKFEETGGIEHIALIKPYLRPMSSMTEEEKKELSCYENSIQRADFYHSHHIDCRFMIEKGLALEAPEGMYES